MEASAGTGKTRLLCDRALAALLTPGYDPAQLVAITFTEKAAAELSARLRAALDDWAAEHPDDVQAARAVERFDRAQISTIHSFAASLLRELPVEAGVDPGFEVLDAAAAALLFEGVWDEWVGAAAETIGRNEPWAALWSHVGAPRPDFLAKALARICAERDIVKLDGYDIPIPDFGGLEAALDAAGRRFAEVRGRCKDPDDRCYRAFEALDGAAEALRAGDLDGLCRTKIKPGGAKSNWQPGALKDELVEEYLKPALSALAEVCDARGRALLPPAVSWLGGAAEAFARRKEEAGVLDFQDLLLGAARLLRRKETGAREYFQRRFRHILVDEFQDTDPLQVELIFYLAEEGPVADDWRDVALVPGKLFVVGDPKQSIYRFRRADVEVYEAARRVVEASGGETLRLTDNFRSAPRLISFVNRAFGGVFGEGEPPYQPAYGKLEPSELAASRAGEGAGAFVLEGPGGEFGSEAAAADAVAAFVRRAVLGSEFDVFDGESETRRHVAYRDFAVLFRSRTHVRTWESALEAWGVPFYTYGGQTFYVRPEVKALAAAARAIDNPADELALVATLTSPLFSLTPDDLLRFRLAGGVFDYRKKLPDDAPAGFRAPRELLGRLHRERPDRTPAATLADLVSSSRLLTKSALWGDGPRAVANVRKILAAARRYAAAGGVGLRGFARWLTEMAEREEAEHESPALDAADDFVRLLTVHAAKGLEFAAVVFADWGRKAGGGRGDAAFVDRRTGLLHLRVGSEKAGTRLLTPGYEDAADREEHFGRCEERRLDYVAATRARDVLVLPAMAEAAEDSLAATVAAFGEDERPVEVVRIDAEAERATLGPAAPEGASAPDLASGRDDWERGLAESVRRAAVPAPIIGASALAHVEEEGDEDVRAPASSSKDALRKGLALHAVMEVLDLGNDAGVAEAAGRACRDLGLGPEDERDVAAWAANCLSSAPVREAAAAATTYREMPFSVTVGDAIVAGKIDLAYEAEDGWVIVDYKSDDPAAASERAGREYRDQMAVYAAALGRVAGVTPVRVYLIFAREADAERRAVSPGPAGELIARGDELLDDAPRRAAEMDVF